MGLIGRMGSYPDRLFGWAIQKGGAHAAPAQALPVATAGSLEAVSDSASPSSGRH